jgi:hypothetical protein
MGLRSLACSDCDSNSAGVCMFVPCECCVMSGRGLCVRLITRPEKSYRLWCLSVIVKPRQRKGPWPSRAVQPWKKKKGYGVSVKCMQKFKYKSVWYLDWLINSLIHTLRYHLSIGQQILQKQVLHTMRSNVPSFKFQYLFLNVIQ